MYNFVLLLVLAILAGHIEYIIYRDGFRSTGRRWFGLFTTSYHIPTILFWWLMCTGLGYWWAIGIFAMVQDMSWYAFNPLDRIDPSDWISRKFGGFRLANFYIPYAYLVHLLISTALFAVDKNLFG